MKVYLDDKRDLDLWTPKDWAGSASVANLTFKFGFEPDAVEAIDFDHDMGLEPDGYEVLRALITLGWRGRVRCHSANPVGAARIKALAEEYGLWDG